MTKSNLFIRFKNGSVADYVIENQATRVEFLDAYANHLKPGTTEGEVKRYNVKQGDAEQILVIDFSNVESVAIT